MLQTAFHIWLCIIQTATAASTRTWTSFFNCSSPDMASDTVSFSFCDVCSKVRGRALQWMIGAFLAVKRPNLCGFLLHCFLVETKWLCHNGLFRRKEPLIHQHLSLPLYYQKCHRKTKRRLHHTFWVLNHRVSFTSATKDPHFVAKTTQKNSVPLNRRYGNFHCRCFCVWSDSSATYSSTLFTFPVDEKYLLIDDRCAFATPVVDYLPLWSPTNHLFVTLAIRLCDHYWDSCFKTKTPGCTFSTTSSAMTSYLLHIDSITTTLKRASSRSFKNRFFFSFKTISA